MQPISLCVTTYNRWYETIIAIEQIVLDKRINNVIIMDDSSTDGSYEKLVNNYKGLGKVKVIKQLFNLNMSRNKMSALSYAKNSFALLADSDNVFTPAYIDALEVVGKLDENTIYQPSFGTPQFNWERYQGIKINKSNIAEYMNDALFRCSLNGCNYVVNPKLYCERYVYNPIIDAADTIHFLYNWLIQGGEYYIVPNMHYLHTVGDQSGFLKNVNKNMEDAIYLENKIRELK